MVDPGRVDGHIHRLHVDRPAGLVKRQLLRGAHVVVASVRRVETDAALDQRGGQRRAGIVGQIEACAEHADITPPRGDHKRMCLVMRHVEKHFALHIDMALASPESLRETEFRLGIEPDMRAVGQLVAKLASARDGQRVVAHGDRVGQGRGHGVKQPVNNPVVTARDIYLLPVGQREYRLGLSGHDGHRRLLCVVARETPCRTGHSQEQQGHDCCHTGPHGSTAQKQAKHAALLRPAEACDHPPTIILTFETEHRRNEVQPFDFFIRSGVALVGQPCLQRGFLFGRERVAQYLACDEFGYVSRCFHLLFHDSFSI